jgi:hypothetical protein
MIGFTSLQPLPNQVWKKVSVHGERGLAQFFGDLMENPPLKVVPEIRA